ncbi:hypothetical protein JXI42_00765 [bacterium]|nr:hypothetical protein [bacterium]
MNYQHQQLASGCWFEMPFLEQMANIGSEVERAILWRDKGNKYSMKAIERALELIELTISDKKNINRLKEITRLREVLIDYFYGDNSYSSSDRLWRNYFYGFGYAVRANK